MEQYPTDLKFIRISYHTNLEYIIINQEAY